MKINEYDKLHKRTGFSRPENAPRDSVHRDRKSDFKRAAKHRPTKDDWMDEWEDEFGDDDQDLR